MLGVAAALARAKQIAVATPTDSDFYSKSCGDTHYIELTKVNVANHDAYMDCVLAVR